MRHGYYIAEKDSCHGDQEYSAKAKEIFQSYGLHLDENGKYQGGRCPRLDGVSIFESGDKVVTRVVLEDFFFAEKVRVVTFDL